MALEAMQIEEFNITNYANTANASAANTVISVELKYRDDQGVLQTITRPNVNFITGIWNHMAADADGRALLKAHIQELARIRALVFAGVNTYADFL